MLVPTVVKLKVGDTECPPAGLPIEQVLGEYSLSFLRRGEGYDLREPKAA